MAAESRTMILSSHTTGTIWGMVDNGSMAGQIFFFRVFDCIRTNLSVTTAVTFSCFCLWFIYSYLHLRQIPGPFLAALSNLPRVTCILTNKAHDKHIDLHRKYGNLVRFGPNIVSIGDPAEIPNVYSFTGKFVKVNRTDIEYPPRREEWNRH